MMNRGSAGSTELAELQQDMQPEPQKDQQDIYPLQRGRLPVSVLSFPYGLVMDQKLRQSVRTLLCLRQEQLSGREQLPRQ